MRRALTIAAILLWASLAHGQTPMYLDYPSTVNPTTGQVSFAPTITPIASGSAVASLVLKAAPAAVYQVTASNAAAAGFLVLINAIAAPSGGASITPLACVPIASGGSATINYAPGPPAAFSIGIVAGVTTTAAGCFTFTTTTAFISGLVM
jgi:hypothetical protein